MTANAEHVLEQALGLPEQDRSEVILSLLETLDEDDDITDAELLKELEDRMNEGFEDSMSWDELRQTRSERCQ